MTDILIKNGRLICPDQGLDQVADVLIKAGRIDRIGQIRESAGEVIDASGKIVCPGLIDMHVHLREPGDGQEETIATGSAAALAGGFTTIVAMPNTDPCIDTPVTLEYVISKARQAGNANVYFAGTITKGRKGEELAELALLTRSGAAAFSDDGSWVASGSVMSKALKYARITSRPIISHCEDPVLSGKGVMNAGALAAKLGLPGIPRSAEEAAVARDLLLARETGGRIHITHVSTAGSVELIRTAKAQGVNVTADVTPHHLVLTEDCVCGYDTNFKVNPPLRSEKDVEALRAALKDGTIDAVASDHAPHSLEEKECEFDKAAFGVIGLESTLAVLITELVEPEILTWSELIAALSIKPARVLGIAKGTLRPGADADVLIIDPVVQWTIDSSQFVSLGRNCPFNGRTVTGQAEITIVGGVVREV